MAICWSCQQLHWIRTERANQDAKRFPTPEPDGSAFICMGTSKLQTQLKRSGARARTATAVALSKDSLAADLLATVHSSLEDAKQTMCEPHTKAAVAVNTARLLRQTASGGTTRKARKTNEPPRVMFRPQAWTLGGRVDHFDAFDSEFNHRVAAVWSPLPHQVFKLMQGTGIRAPTYREYLKILQDTDFVPPQLKPERLRTVEASWQLHGAENAFMLAAYHNRYQQFIAEQPTPDYADEYHYNQPGELITRGLDAEYLHRFGDWNLRVTAAWLDIEESDVEREYPLIAAVGC